MDFGAQSYCFRSFKDNKVVADKIKEIGLSSIELCGVHVDFHDTSTHQAVVDAYRQAGVSIISTGVNMITGDAGDRNLFEFAKAAGTRVMSVNFPLDDLDACLASAETLAEEFDMKLGVHNHGGYHWLGNKTTLAWLFGKSSKRIGLTLDTAWALDARQDPLELAKLFADRLFNVHFKDFTFNPDRTQNDVPVGTGNLDLPAFLNALNEINFSGVSVLEYEGDPENPVPALKQCVEQMRTAGM